jgi:hypothetical protein
MTTYDSGRYDRFVVEARRRQAAWDRVAIIVAGTLCLILGVVLGLVLAPLA